MKYPFNKTAAVYTFLAVYIAYLLCIAFSQKQLPLIGSLIFGILGLYASIITGLMIHPYKMIKKLK